MGLRFLYGCFRRTPTCCLACNAYWIYSCMHVEGHDLHGAWSTLKFQERKCASWMHESMNINTDINLCYRFSSVWKKKNSWKSIFKSFQAIIIKYALAFISFIVLKIWCIHIGVIQCVCTDTESEYMWATR